MEELEGRLAGAGWHEAGLGLQHNTGLNVSGLGVMVGTVKRECLALEVIRL